MFWHYYSAITWSGMEWRVKTSFKIIQVHQSRSNSVWLHQSPLTEASSSVSPMLYKWAGPFKWDYWGGTRERNMTKQGISEEWGEVKEREAIYAFSPCEWRGFGRPVTQAWPDNDPWLPWNLWSITNPVTFSTLPIPTIQSTPHTHWSDVHTCRQFKTHLFLHRWKKVRVLKWKHSCLHVCDRQR